MYRQAAVAGSFYPADAKSVKAFIRENELAVEKVKVSCVLVPHAGYVYSGAVAVRALSNVKIPDTVIIAGPNHTGVGPSVSVFPGGFWETPLGDVPHDGELIEKLCSDDLFTKDTSAHLQEHSIEVIVPILKYFNPEVKIVCITAKYLNKTEIMRAAEHIAECTDDVLFVISSDFNHFENSSITQTKDQAAIDMLMSMDADGLFQTVAKMHISMCGVVPACIGIYYAKAKGAETPVFLEHTHSGVVNGDNARVVGYAGLYYK